jgi:hypothetical protein
MDVPELGRIFVQISKLRCVGDREVRINALFFQFQLGLAAAGAWVLSVQERRRLDRRRRLR